MTLPPDRLRAMARVLDPEAFTTEAEWLVYFAARSTNPDTAERAAKSAVDFRAGRRAKAFAAAQACWEASPGEELVGALKFYSRRDVYEFRGASRYTIVGEDEGNLAREALPQGTET